MVLHQVHPSGDVILTLHNPNAPFAVWESDEEEPKAAAAPIDPESLPDATEGIVTASPIPDTIPDTQLPQFRLSSLHLTSASGYFRRMLTGPWKEASEDGDIKHLNAHDWDEKAFLALMNIIHGRNRNVPREVDLEFVTKIAVMVDYYKCREAVDLWFFDIWYNDLPRPKGFGRDSILRLFISWVFSEDDLFETLTKTALENSKGPVSTLELAFPVDIIDKIEERRQAAIGEIIKKLNDIFVSLWEDDACSFECSSLLLGALMKQLRSRGIPYPLPTAPFLGYSISRLFNKTENFRKLQKLGETHKCPASRPSYYDTFGKKGNRIKEESICKEHCHCNLNKLLGPGMEAIEGALGGLNLKDFPQSSDDKYDKETSQR